MCPLNIFYLFFSAFSRFFFLADRNEFSFLVDRHISLLAYLYLGIWIFLAEFQNIFDTALAPAISYYFIISTPSLIKKMRQKRRNGFFVCVRRFPHVNHTVKRLQIQDTVENQVVENESENEIRRCEYKNNIFKRRKMLNIICLTHTHSIARSHSLERAIDSCDKATWTIWICSCVKKKDERRRRRWKHTKQYREAEVTNEMYSLNTIQNKMIC